MSKEVVNKKEAQVPAEINLEALSGQGTENIGTNDTRLPILKILYASNAILDEDEAKYNPKAKEGDAYNEITGSLYKSKEGFLAVPCHYNNTFNEWADMGKGTGRPVGIHTDPTVMNNTTRDSIGKDRTPEGTYIEDTGNHFVYILNDKYEPVEMALIPMKSTKKKKSKLWNSMIISRKIKGSKGMFNPPSWSQVYRIKTTRESNNDNKWWGWSIEFDSILDTSKHLDALQSAKAFYEQSNKEGAFDKVKFEEEETSTKTINDQATPF